MDMVEWFGETGMDVRPAPGPVEYVREVVAREIAGTGIPPRAAMPAAPFVLSRASYGELFTAASTIIDLLRRAALSAGASTAQRLGAYAVTEVDYPLFGPNQELEERYAACMARPDIVVTAEGLKFLEVNVSGALGGPVELHCLYRAWHMLYGREGVLPFGYDDPFLARSQLFADACRDLNLPRRLAWVGSVRDLKHTTSSRYFDLEIEFLQRRGFAARLFEPEDLHEAHDVSPEQRFALGLRHFTIPEWKDLGIDTAPVRAALDQGCTLLSPQTSAFLANKKTLALISEGQPWMSQVERDLVSRYVPWTRILRDTRTPDQAGNDVDLVPYVLRHQSVLVLKKGIGMQGRQVVLGGDCDTDEWRDHVAAALTGSDSIVQARVEPLSCRLPIAFGPGADVEIVKVAPVLSPFVFGGYRGGVWARFFTDGSTGIVSREGYGALENGVVVGG